MSRRSAGPTCWLIVLPVLICSCCTWSCCCFAWRMLLLVLGFLLQLLDFALQALIVSAEEEQPDPQKQGKG